MTRDGRRTFALAGVWDTRLELELLGWALELATARDRVNGGAASAALADLRRDVTAATQLRIRNETDLGATPAIASEGSFATLYPMTTADVAAMLVCSPANVRARAARGSLPGVQDAPGRPWHFNESEVLASEGQR